MESPSQEPSQEVEEAPRAEEVEEKPQASALPEAMAALPEQWRTPWWLIAHDQSRALATPASDEGSRVVTLYDRAPLLERCLKQEGASFMLKEKGMKPEQLYAMKAAPVAVVADLITIERFESSMCEGGAHPMNSFEFETLNVNVNDPPRALAISEVFDREVVRAALDQDPLLAHLTRYHKRSHEAPREGEFKDLSPCLYEVRIPEPDALKSWAFDALDEEGGEVRVALLFSNPVHACAGQPLRHTVALPTPNALSDDLVRASKAKTLYSQSGKGGVKP